MSLLSQTTMHSRRVGHSLIHAGRSRSNAAWQALQAQIFTPSDESEWHMPLDTESHWHWSNPVNLLPGLILLLMLVIGILL